MTDSKLSIYTLAEVFHSLILDTMISKYEGKSFSPFTIMKEAQAANFHQHPVYAQVQHN